MIRFYKYIYNFKNITYINNRPVSLVSFLNIVHTIIRNLHIKRKL